MGLPSFQEITKWNGLLNGGKRGVLGERAPCPQLHALHYLPADSHDRD